MRCLSDPFIPQAGVAFAKKHNLRVASKASGHDYLGRSTARASLLFWTHYLRNVTFNESFHVGGKDVGSVMTAGSGLPLNLLYPAAEQQGKMFVGGYAATVVAAGGYIQGGGHSPFSPLLGLAVDNVVRELPGLVIPAMPTHFVFRAPEFEIVTADAKLTTVNEVEHPDRKSYPSVSVDQCS